MARNGMTPEDVEERQRAINVFAKRILELCAEKKDMSQTQISLDIGLGSGQISYWVCRNGIPCLPRLIRVSRYFGVSVDYLIGLDDVRNRKEAGGE